MKSTADNARKEAHAHEQAPGEGLRLLSAVTRCSGTGTGGRCDLCPGEKLLLWNFCLLDDAAPLFHLVLNVTRKCRLTQRPWINAMLCEARGDLR